MAAARKGGGVSEIFPLFTLRELKLEPQIRSEKGVGHSDRNNHPVLVNITSWLKRGWMTMSPSIFANLPRGDKHHVSKLVMMGQKMSNAPLFPGQKLFGFNSGAKMENSAPPQFQNSKTETFPFSQEILRIRRRKWPFRLTRPYRVARQNWHNKCVSS